MHAARQIGFADRRECPQLCKLASDYARKSEGCEENIYTFFHTELDGDSLFIKLVEEFERCIISYFAFHWSHADLMISQVIVKRSSDPRTNVYQRIRLYNTSLSFSCYIIADFGNWRPKKETQEPCYGSNKVGFCSNNWYSWISFYIEST